MPLVEDISSLFMQEDLADVRFRLDSNALVPAHRLVCCARSEVFKAMLTGPFLEGGASEVAVPQVDYEAFLELLRFLYTDRALLNGQIVVQVSELARQYMLPELQAQCTTFLEEHMDTTNVCQVLSEALALGEKSVVDYCLKFVRYHPNEVVEGNPGATLSAKGLKTLLADQHWAVMEVKLFHFCLRWADSVGADRRESLMQVLPLLRLPLLSYEDMVTEVADSGVLTDAEQLALFRHKATNGERHSGFPDKPRSSFYLLNYEFELDAKGVIHWIGTSGGVDPFKNPHDSGQVVVSASSIPFGQLRNIVSREQTYTRSDDAKDSWFALDLGNRWLKVSKYTLQHGRDAARFLLRSWVLEGSADGKTWSILDTRTNDCSLDRAWATHSWDVHTDEFVRHVRVRIVGPDSDGGHYLHLTSLELYGGLLQH
mmetsp:Transcript_5493/g.8535  ORF Transcript_5493/g.8535 Transcript_5493/m.8535 type:complete len:428 (+) Transcript_5493:90-1373(+)|eukprot:CAMPEP_0169334774 /NCGR_PEP_ID=MMETSP1017-20121227/15972_1 /TAXON_ID=342587 /ORGANISM="Karlodinium micrum, Strain CCMP2283" /LENGTH=427 /DNA_ID=CAMNT_0009430085 /DNA_START=59 /DNA_END=1342 /DNA_ORIENTATION=+